MPRKRPSASELIRLHKALCLQRAFPTSHEQYREASSLRLARRTQGAVSIDWESIDDTSRLDELLAHLLRPAEDEYFDSGYVSSQEWIDQASTVDAGTDFDWLLAQLQDDRSRDFWSPLYDAAELPLAWNLGDSKYSKSRNTF